MYWRGEMMAYNKLSFRNVEADIYFQKLFLTSITEYELLTIIDNISEYWEKKFRSNTWIIMPLHSLSARSLIFFLPFVAARKTKKQVFVSYNLPGSDLMTLKEVEKGLVEQMKETPDWFWVAALIQTGISVKWMTVQLIFIPVVRDQWEHWSQHLVGSLLVVKTVNMKENGLPKYCSFVQGWHCPEAILHQSVNKWDNNNCLMTSDWNQRAPSKDLNLLVELKKKN